MAVLGTLYKIMNCTIVVRFSRPFQRKYEIHNDALYRWKEELKWHLMVYLLIQ